MWQYHKRRHVGPVEYVCHRITWRIAARGNGKGYQKIPSPKRSAAKSPARRAASEPPLASSTRKDHRRVRLHNEPALPSQVHRDSLKELHTRGQSVSTLCELWFG
jgi:hypothetical protein